MTINPLHIDMPQPVGLHGQWQLSDETGEHVVLMNLPGDVISALEAAGVIGDPYQGRAEYDLRWIAERDWILSRDFSVPDPSLCANGWSLEVDGLDTVAEIRVNGHSVLSAANAFRSFRADVSGALRAGSNRIEIRFSSNIAEAKNLQDAQPFYVPYHAGNCPIRNGNMLRKSQCHFGWDWNIALAPFGLYGDIAIAPNADYRIASLSTAQSHSDGNVELVLRLTAAAIEAGETDLSISVAGARLQERIWLSAGENTFERRLMVNAPDLWWPAGHGRQTLHELSVSVGSACQTRRIGFRDLRLITDADEVGHRFCLSVNGREIFCRGANWIPADALPGRITREKTEHLLASALAANMNMIRVWGGGQYESEWFYDYCDEHGLLVWQDFMFACNLYPATPEFLANVEQEVREQSVRLSSHPSVALFCGDNELIGALTWFKESVENRDRYLVAYDRLNRTIENALKSVLPEAVWWPSSPSPGPMSFGDAWHDDTSGDMHFWSVWHEGRDFAHYRDVSPRFCSEFGFQSFPSMSVIRTFASDDDMNIASPVMESHQKNAGGNARIAETMFRYFRFPSDFGNFVYLSQVQQGLAIRTAVEYWRSLKPHCMGALYWQLNDTWPVASWSSLDYGGGWKALHYMARRFFSPVQVFALPSEDGGLRLSAVNDGADPVEVTYQVERWSFEGSHEIFCEGRASVPADRAIDLPVETAAYPDATGLTVYRWQSSCGLSGWDHVMPAAYKGLDLHKPDITTTVEEVDGRSVVTLATDRPALFVTLETDLPVRFSDNVLTLLPGRPVSLDLEDMGKRPPGEILRSLTIRNLYSSSRA
ncbi:beta-mannosidase [Roseibium sp.]|uniref:beta-mannosidase n=1 Tax=Roseibium sp. TaxID=1936156 RepID=UPI003A97F443